jgi:cyclopropane-fatty-acyl-phospholipid synthase
MIEAVGHHYYNLFFQTCSRLLQDDGLMALQAITIGDHIFDRHK